MRTDTNNSHFQNGVLAILGGISIHQIINIPVSRVFLEFLKFLLLRLIYLIIILCQFLDLVKVVLVVRANTRPFFHKFGFFYEQLWLLKLFKSHVFEILNVDTSGERYVNDTRFLRFARFILLR